MENKKFKEAVLNHFNQIVNDYEVVEYREADEIEYVFNHKHTGETYIQLVYSTKDTIIEVRLLGMKGVCLIKRSLEQSLIDFIHLSIEDLMDRIVYLDIPGDPAFYYSSKLSNKELSILSVASNKGLQVKLITLVAEVQLALHFSGLVYLNNNKKRLQFNDRINFTRQ